MNSDGIVVYPDRVGALIGLPLAGALAATLFGGFVLTPMGTIARVLFGLLWGVVALVWLGWALTTLAELRGPRLPLFRVDSDGIESADGRIWWSDIDRVETRYEYPGEGVKNLWFRVFLRPRREPHPPSASYLEESIIDSGPRRGDGYLDVPLILRERELRDAFRRFTPSDVQLVPRDFRDSFA